MRKMNLAVDQEGKSPGVVAEEFLGGDQSSKVKVQK
jgi:glycine betaine/choline ABC-type transport system substrate-binding protein